MIPPSLHRIAAFTTVADGGNPAGVWLGEQFPEDAAMQRLAAEIGFSETAFVTPMQGARRRVRYFSPEAEVPFCGHATIATGAVLGETSGVGRYELETSVGIVPVTVRERDGRYEASLTSVEPMHVVATPALVASVLGTLHWGTTELDPSIPAARIYAGAWHLLLAVRRRARLDSLAYDFEGLKEIMLREGLTTIQLVWRGPDGVFHSRNPFPVGGIVEDPATGAATAAFGGYLRGTGLVDVPASLVIMQGEAMGRPSRIVVDVPPSGGIVVTGAAVAMDAKP
jgi:phenazine biosynthesis protein PhzF family